MKILNLGCGDDLSIGTHFLDNKPYTPRVMKHDLDYDLFPFPDEFFAKVYSKNVFEHLKNPQLFLSECYRVLTPYGYLELITDNAYFFPFYIRPLPAFLLNKIFKINCFGVHSKSYKARHKADKHYAIYTGEHLENHLHIIGFTKVKINEGIYYDRFNKAWIKKLLKSLQFELPRLRVIASKL